MEGQERIEGRTKVGLPDGDRLRNHGPTPSKEQLRQIGAIGGDENVTKGPRDVIHERRVGEDRRLATPPAIGDGQWAMGNGH